jgi:DNA-binding transcriptional MocR family regulator
MALGHLRRQIHRERLRNEQLLAALAEGLQDWQRWRLPEPSHSAHLLLPLDDPIDPQQQHRTEHGTDESENSAANAENAEPVVPKPHNKRSHGH